MATHTHKQSYQILSVSQGKGTELMELDREDPQMTWRVGNFYWRRDGGVAMFHGLSMNMPIFFHPDLAEAKMPSAFIAHEWNGKVSCAHAIRPYCRDYDVISDDSDTCVCDIMEGRNCSWRN